MDTPLITAATIIALAVLFVLLPLVAHTYQRYRYKKALKCPATEELAEVDIDAPRAAFSSAFSRPLLRVKNCTLWPERKGCGEGCLRQ